MDFLIYLNFFSFLTVFWVVFDYFSLWLRGMFQEGSFAKNLSDPLKSPKIKKIEMFFLIVAGVSYYIYPLQQQQ